MSELSATYVLATATYLDESQFRETGNSPMRYDPSTPAARVFVIDDDPHIRSLLRTLLKSGGYQVEEFW